jgi:hypothetical protein
MARTEDSLRGGGRSVQQPRGQAGAARDGDPGHSSLDTFGYHNVFQTPFECILDIEHIKFVGRGKIHRVALPAAPVRRRPRAQRVQEPQPLPLQLRRLQPAVWRQKLDYITGASFTPRSGLRRLKAGARSVVLDKPPPGSARPTAWAAVGCSGRVNKPSQPFEHCQPYSTVKLAS